MRKRQRQDILRQRTFWKSLALDYPIVAKILEYRQLAKLKSTYADGLAVYIENDGRIHGKFNQTVTATGRLSSTEPNLQNIPVRMELGRLIRKVFVPQEGYVFVDADYPRLNCAFWLTAPETKQLIQAYREARDIHRMTASQVFHTPFDEVTDLQEAQCQGGEFRNCIWDQLLRTESGSEYNQKRSSAVY